MTDFHPWGKTARLFRDITITEKIDGTNAQIYIEDVTDEGIEVYPSHIRDGEVTAGAVNAFGRSLPGLVYADAHGQLLYVRAGSRKRWVTADDDNFGFARFVYDNVAELVKLGEGRHYGEWWGSGIQRGYALPQGHKVFSLFNTTKWYANPLIQEINGGILHPHTLTVVPVLAEGAFNEEIVREVAEDLQAWGSAAAKHFDVTFDRPEGIIVYHQHSNQVFKYTPYEKEDGHKG